jgi:hypothetical protein
MCSDKELERKRKLRYYKDVINPNLEDQNYPLPSVKKKISIAKIRTSSQLSLGKFLNPHGMKECITFVILRMLKMKNTFS